MLKSPLVKVSRALIGLIVTTVISICSLYFGIEAKIQGLESRIILNQKDADNSNAIQDIKIKALELRVDQLQLQIEQLKKDLNK